MAAARAVAGMDPRIKSEDDRSVNRWRTAINANSTVIAGLDPVGVGRHSSAGQSMREARAVAGMDPPIKSQDDRSVSHWRTAINPKLTVIAGLDPLGGGKH